MITKVMSVGRMVMMSTGPAKIVSLTLRPASVRPQYRTEHVIVDEEVIARLRRVKVKEKVGCKEKISARRHFVSIGLGKSKDLVLRTYTPADQRPDTLS